jgi:hypothetical protein
VEVSGKKVPQRFPQEMQKAVVSDQWPVGSSHFLHCLFLRVLYSDGRGCFYYEQNALGRAAFVRIQF